MVNFELESFWRFESIWGNQCRVRFQSFSVISMSVWVILGQFWASSESFPVNFRSFFASFELFSDRSGSAAYASPILAVKRIPLACIEFMS